jgi:hypothetical protein
MRMMIMIMTDDTSLLLLQVLRSTSYFSTCHVSLSLLLVLFHNDNNGFQQHTVVYLQQQSCTLTLAIITAAIININILRYYADYCRLDCNSIHWQRQSLLWLPLQCLCIIIIIIIIIIIDKHKKNKPCSAATTTTTTTIFQHHQRK